MGRTTQRASGDSDKNFVEIVVGPDVLLHEGKAVGIDEIRKMLEAMTPEKRRNTVLAVAAASPTVTVERFFNATGQLSKIVEEYKLAHLSETGIATTAALVKSEQSGAPLEPAKQYFVNGAVNRAGVYSVAPGQEVNVKQAISAAGGINSAGDVTVSVIRTQQGRESEVMDKVSVDDLFSGREKDIPVRPGDIIQVNPPLSGEYYLDGVVKRTGVYSLTARNITLKQAIAAAGGFDKGLKDASICIIRRQGRDKETWPVWNRRFSDILSGKEADIILQPNDIVRVLEKPETTPAPPLGQLAPATQPRSGVSPAAAEPGMRAEQPVPLNILLAQRAQVQSRLDAARQHYGENHPAVLNAKAMRDDLDSRIAAASVPKSPEQIAQKDPTMREYLKTLESLEIRLQQLSRNVGPRNPRYIEQQRDIELLKQRIGTYAEAYRKQFGVDASDAPDMLDTRNHVLTPDEMADTAHRVVPLRPPPTTTQP